MNLFVQIISIALFMFFLVAAKYKPIALYFLLVIVNSNFFGTIEAYQYPIKLFGFVSLYIYDIINIISLIIVISKRKELNVTAIKYKNFINVLFVFFCITILLRFLIYTNDFSFFDLKNSFRIWLNLIWPLYFLIFFKKRDIPFLILSLSLIVLIASLVFFLEFFELFKRVALSQLGFAETDLYVEGLKRITVFGQPIMNIAPVLLISYYFITNKRFLVAFAALPLFVMFFSTFRSSFYSTLFPVMIFFTFVIKTKRLGSIYLALILFVIFSAVVSNIFFPEFIDSASFRMGSTFDEIKYQEGTTFDRMRKSDYLISLMTKEPDYYIYGIDYTSVGKDMTIFVSNDLGIIDTIAHKGILLTSVLVYLFVLFYKSTITTKTDGNIVFIKYAFRSYLLGAIPALLFSLELTGYLLTNAIIFYSLILAYQNFENNN